MLNLYEKLILVLSHPSTWINFIYRLVIGLRTRLRANFVGMYSEKWYPPSIRNLVSNFKIENKVLAPQFQFDNIFSQTLNENKNFRMVIKILNQEFTESEFLTLVASSSDIKDEEVRLSLHRFQFISTYLAECLNPEIVKWLSSIVSKWYSTTPKSNSYAYSAYTISERLVNLVILSCAEKKIGINSQTCIYIKNDLCILMKRLEYPASEIINNHVLNNARALYIAGTYLGELVAIEVAKKILKLHLPEMISEAGVLMENSTHYQLLLTKNMLEVAIVAKAVNDTEFDNWLSKVVKKMLYVSEAFIPKNLNHISHMPLIGDVSPDMRTDWFDLLKKSDAWFRLWKFPVSFNESNDIAKMPNHLNGWQIIQLKNWYVITNSHHQKTGYPAGHGHEDWGSFYLYFNNVPIIVDPGRVSYSQASNHDINSQYHVSILCENKPVIETFHGPYATLSKVLFRKLKFMISEDNDSWSWENSNIWQRRLHFQDNSQVVIFDRYLKERSYKVIFPLSYLAKVEKISDNLLVIEFQSVKIQFVVDGKCHLAVEQYRQSVNYGEYQIAHKIIVNRTGSGETTYLLKILE